MEEKQSHYKKIDPQEVYLGVQEHHLRYLLVLRRDSERGFHRWNLWHHPAPYLDPVFRHPYPDLLQRQSPQ
jgi:hypothetical protein